MHTTVILLSAIIAAAPVARAVTLPVAAGESIQAAIAAAQDGDVVEVGAGTFAENIDFLGKNLRVVGAGAASVLRGIGGPVVTFAGGESQDAVLDSFTITGGLALRGGGIRIVGSSPTIVRNIIVDNRAAERGSGVYLEASQAELYNNLIVYNGHAGGDPHSVEIQSASPIIVNNTIARGDSNGLIVRGASAPLIMNNVIALNGAVVNGSRRGRGICDFSGGGAVIRYNVFYKNRVAALLTDGSDFKRIRSAQQGIAPPRLEANLDGSPRFMRRAPRDAARARIPEDFMLRSGGQPRAIDGGNPDALYADRDGSRNDIGFTGGPHAAQ